MIVAGTFRVGFLLRAVTAVLLAPSLLVAATRPVYAGFSDPPPEAAPDGNTALMMAALVAASITIMVAVLAANIVRRYRARCASLARELENSRSLLAEIEQSKADLIEHNRFLIKTVMDLRQLLQTTEKLVHTHSARMQKLVSEMPDDLAMKPNLDQPALTQLGGKPQYLRLVVPSVSPDPNKTI